MQLVVFSHAGEQYALPIASVSEIIRNAAPRTVASDAPGVRGVIGLRGKIVPIVDLTERLGLPCARDAAADDGKILILDVDGAHSGVLVDDVDEVVTVSESQLEEVPLAGSAIERVAKIDDRLVMILDAASLATAVPAAAAPTAG